MSESIRYGNFVSDEAATRARARLKERLDAGEDAFDVLEIDRREAFYVNKIVAGKVPISYTIYERIMECKIPIGSKV